METQKTGQKEKIRFLNFTVLHSKPKNIGQRIFRKPALGLTALLTCAIKWEELYIHTRNTITHDSVDD